MQRPDLDEIRRLQTELKETKKLNERYRFEIEAMKSQLPVRTNLIAEDKKMLFVLMLAHRVAQVDSTVLILGETGTGKDEIAKYIHQNSSRADRNFVDVNCGAITESLFESELFGHEKYAFTGAGNREKIGLLEAADHGTLFLDEIGELSLNMQTKLLRVLQNQSFKRVGGVKPIHVDVRIISATNCDLGQMVQEKKFREDLYYRLNVISIKIPPLRERPDDIIPLAQYFLAFYNRKYGFSRKLSPTACVNLLSNRWVGNVRELKNVVEQSVIMAETDTIDTNNLLVNSVASMQFFNQQEPDMGMAEIMERMELQFLSASYEKYGKVRDAAKHLGLAPSTYVRHKKALMRKYPTPQSII
jgi:transcriptional regulator with PAS, ATPase and Fis domain